MVSILLVQAALAVVATLLLPSVPAVRPLLGPATSILVATIVEPTAAGIAAIGLTVNALWVAIAVMLWRRRGGARVALVVFGGAGLLLTSVFLLSAEPVEFAVDLLTGAGTVTALLLLCRRDVRAWYRLAD